MSTVTPSNDFVQIRPEVQSSRLLSQPQLNEYEIKSMEEQQRRLKYFTDTTNEEQQKTQEQQLFYNLSLANILSKLSSTIISIINELLAINQETQFNDVIYIFVKEDRLIYLGILFIIISIAMYLIDVTG
jgi:hypothetical protein